MMKTKRLHILTALAVTLLLCSACKDNLDIMFSDFFVAFEPGESTSTRISCNGTSTGTFVVHLCSEQPKNPVNVTYSVTAQGLEEGIDYTLASSSRNIRFMPGIYKARIQVNWLKHELEKEGTLTLRLETVEPDFILGYPGPSEKNRSIVITKYKP